MRGTGGRVVVMFILLAVIVLALVAASVFSPG